MTTSRFTVGGAVQAGGGVYIERKADRDLIDLCSAGTFAYILAPRQIGKSSLMLHTVQRLRQRGIACVTIILASRDVTPDQWYRSLLVRIADQLHLRTNPQRWWAEHNDLSSSERFKLFLQEVLPAETTQRVVIFIDEIELTLGLAFADDFFSALRSLYDERASIPALKRISFVLIGAASPSELIMQPSRAPFNIGRAVTMTDFTFDEAQQLVQGFSAPLEDSTRVLGYILDWTGGHPYLTQCLCSALLDQNESWDQAGIARLVRHTLFGSSETYNSNLQEVQRTIAKRSEDPYATLTTYRSILRRGHIPNSAQSPAKAALKLSGIVANKNDRLEVRNNIYRTVFDEGWVQEQLESLPNYLPRRILHTLQYAAYILLVPLILLAAFAVYQWYRADEKSLVAQHAVATAEIASNLAQTAGAAASAAAEQEKNQRRSAEAAALALHALARRGDGDFSLRTLLSAAQREWTPTVDQAMRQIMVSQQCVQLKRPLYDAVWPAGGPPNVLIAASAGLPEPAAPNLLVRQIEPVAARAAWLSLDGNSMLVPFGEDTAQIMEVTTRRVRAQLVGTGGALRRAIWSLDGVRVVTFAESGAARVWDTASGEPLRALDDGTQVTDAAWSYDSRRIVTGGADGTLRIWRADDHQPPIKLNTPAGAVERVAWRTDDTRIAASVAGAVHIWDAQNGRLLLTLDAQAGPIQTVGWSPRMLYVMTVSQDAKLRIWNAENGARLSALDVNVPVVAAAWSAQDRQIAIANQDGTICMHDTPEGMLASAKEREIEPLPAEQVDRLLQELLPTPLVPTNLPTTTPTPIVPATAYPAPATLEPTPTEQDVVTTPRRVIAPSETPEPASATPESATATPLPVTVTPEPASAIPTTPKPRPATATDTPKPATVTPEPATVTPEPQPTADAGTPTEPTPAEPTIDPSAPTADPSAPTEPSPTVGESEPTATLSEPSAEPTVAEPEPTVAEPEPTVAEPEPTASDTSQ